MSELCLAAQAAQSFWRNTRVQEEGIHHQKNTALHPDVLRLRLSVGLSGSHSLSILLFYLPHMWTLIWYFSSTFVFLILHAHSDMAIPLVSSILF